MKLWAHRGCSQRYPENTLIAFEKAAQLQGLAGIELDIQLTKDGQIVVIHDEKVDRTTDGSGWVRDYTLAELKRLKIDAGCYPHQVIPTMEEVFELLEERLKAGAESGTGAGTAAGTEAGAESGTAAGAESGTAAGTAAGTDTGSQTGLKPGKMAGLRLNIELKNSILPYDGMEEKIIDMVHDRGLEGAVVYSTFWARSLEKIHYLDPEAELGILDTRISDCMYKLKGGCGATALHPFWRAMDLPAEQLRGYTVRAWMSGHLYPEKSTGTRLKMEWLEEMGITDLILNEPEVYLE